jgi:hypothetical protein
VKAACTTEKRIGRPSNALKKSTINARKCSVRSTSTQAQVHRILVALRRGPQSTDQLRRLGCYQAPARIFDLRAKGYIILTELFNGYASDGYSHARMARYTLVTKTVEQSRTIVPTVKASVEVPA